LAYFFEPLKNLLEPLKTLKNLKEPLIVYNIIFIFGRKEKGRYEKER
jgi:hypothetical protein